jgi:hypothetical protein
MWEGLLVGEELVKSVAGARCADGANSTFD